MMQLGLKPIGDGLPFSFPKPSGFWQPEISIKDCFSGTYNGIEVAVFRVQIGSGDGVIMRYSVAARRSPWNRQFVTIQNQSIEIDSTSTVGWIVTSIRGRFPSVMVVKTLLRILTADAPPSATLEADLLVGYPSSL